MKLLFNIANTFYAQHSAGIGRTGTYIALDALYKSGKATGKVNVAEYVKSIRSNGMDMVQNCVRFHILNEQCLVFKLNQ